MRYELIMPLLVIGLFFGLIGGLMAFANTYEGYSHFPMIGKRKQWRLSLSVGIAAMLFVLLAVLAIIFLIGYMTV